MKFFPLETVKYPFSIVIKHVTALDAIIYPTIEPIINPILVYLIIGETLGNYAVWCGAMVLGSVIIRAVIKKLGYVLMMN